MYQEKFSSNFCLTAQFAVSNVTLGIKIQKINLGTFRKIKQRSQKIVNIEIVVEDN